MPKTALLIEMINLLRSRPGVSINELALSLSRSERTIYRWISELSGEIGAPVHFREGGYFLVEEDESDARFTPEELLALKTGLKSAVFTEESPLRRSAESAWNKIRDASPYEKLQVAHELSDSYSIHLTAPKGFIKSDIPHTIGNAISQHHRLKISYRSQKSNQVKQYTIDPYALVFRRHSWYLLADCLEHGKVTQFKMVRFREATDTGIKFKLPNDFSAEDYFRLSWEAWASGKPVNVRIRFSPKVAVMVAETRRHPTQQIHPQIDGGIIFEATVSGIEEIAIWIMGFGKDAEALEPVELREYILDHAQCMTKIYNQQQDSQPVNRVDK